MTKHNALSEGSSQVVNRELGILIMDPPEVFSQQKEGYSDGQVPRDGRAVGNRSPIKMYGRVFNERLFTKTALNSLHSTLVLKVDFESFNNQPSSVKG